MTDLIALGQRVLDAQPFARHVGTRLVSMHSGQAVLEIEVRPELLQQNGFVHGGVLAYAADNALTFAGGSVLGESVLTSGFSIEYLRPATEGPLIATATVISSTRRSAVCRCEVTAGSLLCASAHGVIRLVE